jgi:hypothetical protein
LGEEDLPAAFAWPRYSAISVLCFAGFVQVWQIEDVSAFPLAEEQNQSRQTETGRAP